MNNSKTFKPYIIHSFYTWALENYRTPHICIESYMVTINPPYSYESPYLTLKMHPDSIRNLIFSIDTLYFTTFFNGLPYAMEIPYSSIRKIFCKDTKYGFDFDSEDRIIEQKGISKTILSVIEGGNKS